MKLLGFAIILLFSTSVFAKPGTYTCFVTEEYNFNNTHGLFSLNTIAVEFHVPVSNAPRSSHLQDVYMEYDLITTILLAHSETRNIGEYGKINLKNVVADSAPSGGVDYKLGETESGFTTFVLNLPRLAKNIDQKTEATLWLTNNLRNIMSDIKLLCSID